MPRFFEFFGHDTDKLYVTKTRKCPILSDFVRFLSDFCPILSEPISTLLNSPAFDSMSESVSGPENKIFLVQIRVPRPCPSMSVRADFRLRTISEMTIQLFKTSMWKDYAFG